MDANNSIVYKVVNDDRTPIKINHSRICYPPAIDQTLIDRVDTSYPGIVIEFDNDYYLIEDGVHRIANLQQHKIYESLFYVVTRQEYENGMVDMIYNNQRITLGRWNNPFLDPISHQS